MDNASYPTYEYLIGPPISELPHQLPLEIDILKLYSHFERSTPESERINKIIQQLQNCYHYADIPIRQKGTVRIKIKRLLE